MTATAMSFPDIMEQVGNFFNAFNILNMGLIVVWIVGSFFLANAITEKRDEKAVATMMFLVFGGIIFFANDPFKYVILIVTALFVIYGFFKMLYKRKTESYN